jgi:hypothetical protein
VLPRRMLSAAELDRDPVAEGKRRACLTGRVASIGSDFPGSRTDRRELSVSPAATRITRSPLASSPRSRRPETCRQSSTAHTRSTSSSPANRSASRVPSSLAAIVSCPRTIPITASTATSACDRLCLPRSRSSAPSLRWRNPATKRISGGHTSVGAMPRSLSGHAVLLGRRRATEQKSVTPRERRQSESESARRCPRAKPTSRTRQDQLAPEHRREVCRSLRRCSTRPRG